MDFLTNPFIVALLFLYRAFGESLFVAIVVFTIITRAVTFPLTQQQLKSSKKMQELAPALKELKERYKGDREKQAQAQMVLYRQYGINPLAGCLPLVIQMPILFGLYGAIYSALGNTPLQFVDLHQRLLIPNLSQMLPLKTSFAWLNLGQPDPLFILPVLVVATTWLQMKLTMPPPPDPKDPSAAMTRNMTTIMPLMIGLFSISFASGLSIYWVVGNVLGIVQYALMGRIDFRTMRGKANAPTQSISIKDLDLKEVDAMPSRAKPTGANRPAPATASAPAKSAPVVTSTKRKLSESRSVQQRKSPKR
ncbi:MAG: membrane protein insertase YidC [Anaerolinea sp.]|nr:membrane protein insertase YidC [Anaerolinea sp.]MCC6974445.1 membrane protein insertase YidC [Anaerolineae bacterium]CAG0996602.1 Membrane protein insertase MisCA [Anaerolineae bacterium]